MEFYFTVFSTSLIKIINGEASILFKISLVFFCFWAVSISRHFKFCSFFFALCRLISFQGTFYFFGIKSDFDFCSIFGPFKTCNAELFCFVEKLFGIRRNSWVFVTKVNL